jgi:hypothetical protein
MVHGKNNHWHGDLLLFTTWRMKDGTNLSPSPLHLIKSYSGVNDRHDCKNSVGTSSSPLERWEDGADIYLGLTKEAVGDAHNFDDFLSANLLCSSQNKVRISFPASADTSAVHSIAVWCTRPYPVFSTDNITVNRKQNSSTNFRQRDEQKIINASSFTSFYDNTNIADQPFYLLKEFELSETLTDGDIKYVEVLHDLDLIEDRFYAQIKYGTDDERTICLIKNGLSLSSAMLLLKKYGDHLRIDVTASTVIYGENLVSEMIKAKENQIQIYEVQSCM